MRKYDIAAYIWPAYTGDEPRARIFRPEGMDGMVVGGDLHGCGCLEAIRRVFLESSGR